MKKVIAISMIFLTILSTFAIFSPQVKATTDQPFQVLWRVPITDNIAFGADAGDVDGDGVDDVVVVSSDGHYGAHGTDNTMQVIKSDGTELWSRTFLIEAGKAHVADIDGDGKSEVFASGSSEDWWGSDALVYAFDDNGDQLWLYQETIDTGFWLVAAGNFIFTDIDADSLPEMVVVDGGYRTHYAYALDGDGSTLWRFDGDQYSDVIFSDVTGDGVEEIILPSHGTYRDSNVYVLDKSGNLIWNYPTNFHGMSWYWQVANAGDLTGDGVNDIAVVAGGMDGFGWANLLYVLRNDSTFLWSKQFARTQADAPSRPIVTDVDGDGISDVILFVERGVNAYKHDGSLLWSFDYGFDYAPWPSLFDIDRDSEDEIIFQKDQEIYELSLDGSVTLIGTLENQGRLLPLMSIVSGKKTSMPVSGDVNNDGFDELIIQEIIGGQYYVSAVCARALPIVNLIKNSGFEELLNYWSISEGTATYMVDGSDPRSGAYSAKGIELNEGSLGRLYQDVTHLVASGWQYKISGWIKTQDVVGWVVIALDYVASNGWTPADGYVKEIGYVTGTQDWTYYESDVFTLPPMPDDAVATWFLFDFNAGKGTAWWDDVSLIEVEPPPHYELVKKYFPHLIFDEEEEYFPTNFYHDDKNIDNNPSNYDKDTWPLTVYVHTAEGRWYDWGSWSGGEKDWLVIQYWFYYAKDPMFWEIPILGAHDHDWESVFIFLEKKYPEPEPEYVVYFHHAGGVWWIGDKQDSYDRVSWEAPLCPICDVDKVDGTHPVVHVARNSHASYPWTIGGWSKPLQRVLVPVPVPELPGWEIVELPYAEPCDGGRELDYNHFEVVTVKEPNSQWPTMFGEIPAPWAQERRRWNDPGYLLRVVVKLSLSIVADSPVNLLVTAPDGLRTGYDPESESVVNEIVYAIYSGPGSEPQVITIPDPLAGVYNIETFGIGSGPYTITLETQYFEGSLIDSQTYAGETVEGIVYVYTVSITDEEMTTSPDPVAELEHLEEFVMNLPDDVFVTDDPDEFVEFKKEMVDKIYETFEELYENKYMEAIEKLGDMREEVIDEDRLRSSTRFDLCVIIDHIISGLEMLQQETQHSPRSSHILLNQNPLIFASLVLIGLFIAISVPFAKKRNRKVQRQERQT